jgi:hypothetical protein
MDLLVDILSSLPPYVFAGLTSLFGLRTLLRRRIDFGEGWNIRGRPAVLLSLFALPALPVVAFINPTWADRAEQRQDREDDAEVRIERLERLEEIKARRKQIEKDLAELEDARPEDPPPSAPENEELLLRLVRQAQRMQRNADYHEWLERRLLLFDEEEDLDFEEHQLERRLIRAEIRTLTAGEKLDEGQLAFLLSVVWLGATYALAQFCGGKKTEPPDPAAVNGPSLPNAAPEAP